jgi:hypothetical protein
MHVARTIRTALALLALLAVAATPAALAANSEQEKLRFAGTFTEDDFCGTGAPVSIDSSFHGTLFNAPNQSNYEFWLTIQAEDVFTNLVTGQKATIRSAGTQRWWFLHDGDPATPPLSVTLDTGLRSQLVTPGAGGLRTRDAGYVVLQFTFTIFDGHVVVEHGPHPQLAGLLEAGSDTFCTMMTEALDL